MRKPLVRMGCSHDLKPAKVKARQEQLRREAEQAKQSFKDMEVHLARTEQQQPHAPS